ncbi:nuclear transport factor 2 family protein [Haliangium ochraceum]|uniref:Phenazine biosynthesis protein n=1 Tax=Haliangium ochraceum (strain DSM 14365 / JCM 11303 / SMP-2) TaxID=502025 RepID=D0LQY4_HALO1|nr:nuclear transport factor 2 family protein [Haliangium ochraceum]ACY15492.1 phenazine biosynthesis protein [Haliangium ochraceum DSM 14365]
MTTEQLLTAHLEHVTRDDARWLALFADDAVIEFPYALDTPTRLVGRDAIARFCAEIFPFFDELRFSALRLYQTTDPAVVLAEVHGSARITTTGAAYEQDYVMYVRSEAGRIVHYREYWNPTGVGDAFGSAL